MPDPARPEPSTTSPPATERFTKTGAAPLTRRRLRREAAALRRAAHPDVVRFLGLTDLPDRTELHTERLSDPTLLDVAPTDGASALAFATTLAATVADLHGIGVVHGRLTPDHVLVRGDGRPVLCGFAEAGTQDASTDVHALGTLFEVLATALDRDGTRRDRRAAETLLRAAEHARTASPPPTATDLAHLLAAKPSKGTKGTKGPRAAKAPKPAKTAGTAVPRRRTLVVAASGLGVVVLVVALWPFGNPSGDPSWLGASPDSTSTVPSASDPPPATEPSSAGPPARFVAEGASYAVGTADDVVVVGDWDCDGVVGAALLQRADGDVFVFDELASKGAPVTGRFVAQVAGAVDLDVIEQADGCSSLAARHGDGSPRLIAVGAP